eukprot:6491193-Amphidinium_carterae.2
MGFFFEWSQSPQGQGNEVTMGVFFEVCTADVDVDAAFTLFHDLIDVLLTGRAVPGLWSCFLDGYLWQAVGQDILSSVIALPSLLRSNPVPEDMEIACGFPCRYTPVCLPTSARKLKLVRRAFPFTSVFCVMELLRVAACGLWLHEHSFAGPSFSDLPNKAVRSAISATDHKGSDVRVSLEEIMKPSIWPRWPIQFHLWLWHNVFVWRWQSEARITDLELRAAVLAGAAMARLWTTVFTSCGQSGGFSCDD